MARYVSIAERHVASDLVYTSYIHKGASQRAACGTPRRRDLATSLALRDGRGEGGSARGQGPRDTGLSLGASLATKRGLAAEKSQKNSASVLMLRAAAAAGSSSSRQQQRSSST